MDYATIPGVTKPVSRLVQGTMLLGSDVEADSFALLDAVVEAGCTAFDVAHVYGGGAAERMFGRWLRDRGVREQIVIVGKGAHHNADRARVTPFDIAADLHDSLARMQVEQIDLYLLHRDDPAVPVGPIMEALNHWQRAGLITAFGASNWHHERIDEANRYALEHDLMPFAASSPNFSLADQREAPWPGCVTISGPAGAAVRAWYTHASMPLITWSSLAGGFWSGRFRRDNVDTFTHDADRLCIRCYASPENFERLDRATALAAAKNVTLPQIALAYVLNQPLPIFALVGCRTGAEFRANAAAGAITLTDGELAWLDLRAPSAS